MKTRKVIPIALIVVATPLLLGPQCGPIIIGPLRYVVLIDPEPLNTNAESDLGADTRPQLATDGLDNWVAVWQSDDDLGETTGIDLDILVSQSADNGATWTAPVPLNSSAATDSGDDQYAVLSTDGGGTWLAIWQARGASGSTIGSDFDILVSRSIDNGTSWQYELPLNTNAYGDSGEDIDAYITTDGHGTWVAVWCSDDELSYAIGPDFDILVSRSTDAGANWSDPLPLNSNAADDSGDDERPRLTTDGLGNWLAVWQSTDDLGGTIGPDLDVLYSISTDDGTSWSAPLPLNNNAASDSGDDERPALATDGTGNWVAVWQSTDELAGTIGPDTDILFSRSIDHGLSWADPLPVNSNAASDSGDDERPQPVTDSDGNWVTVWQSNDDLGDTLDEDLDLLGSHSTDDGATWGSVFVLNKDAPSDDGSDRRPYLATDKAGTWVWAWDSTENVEEMIGIDPDILFARTAPDSDTCSSIASGDWNLAATWDCNIVPGAADDVEIAPGHVVKLQRGETVRHVMVHPGGMLDVDGTHTLDVKGNFTADEDSFVPRQGTVRFSGPKNQTITGAPHLYRLEITKTSNDKTVSGDGFTVEDEIKVLRGHLQPGPYTAFNHVKVLNTSRMTPKPSAVIDIGGDFEKAAGAVFDHNFSKIRFSGALYQMINGAPEFHDVEVEKETANDELHKLESDPGTKVNGHLRLMKGQYEPDDVDVKDVTIEQSAKLKQKLAKLMVVRGDFLKQEAGSFTQNLGVIRFDGSEVQQKVQMAGLMNMKATLLNENGLLMKQLPTASGAGESEINVCGTAVHLDEFDVGDEMIAKCGSLVAEVVEGPVELFPDEQRDLMATVPNSTKTTITDLGDGVFEIENDSGSQGAVVVTIGDSEFQITPGGKAPSDSCGTLHVQVDLHTIGSGDHPGSTREGIPGSEVRVFD